MPTERKIEQVADLKERLERASMVVGAEYRGLTVKEMQDLRRKLREGGLEVKVVKNTLLRRAADEAGKADVSKVVEGPTALAITYGDPIEAAKAITGYAQTAPQAFSLRGGYMDGAVLSVDDLKSLTTIPPRPVLISQFMGTIQGPLASFVGLIDAPLREFAGLTQSLLGELPGLIEARARQLEATG
jgi:large subunit ribosomal protein L10